MDVNSQDPFVEPADETELELYTIPTYSRWFSWDEIHETERVSLREFFDGASISRTPRIYKEYRDFIITKYREDPSRRLTFTEVRKSLVGDISLLRKVFLFLEKWGLINFSAPSDDLSLVGVAPDNEGEGEEGFRVRTEEGPPHGVRVVVNPNSLKPLPVPASVRENGGSEFKSPPLASYSDVFIDSTKPKGSVCANCGERCDSGHYEYLKGSSAICVKCFKSRNYGENKSADDFNFIECTEDNGTSGTSWTDAENLLLLESVLKHGDDWELVAQSVQTKTKLECISRLIEMPFGDLMLGSFHGRSTLDGANDNVKQVHLDSSESQETLRTEDQCHEQLNGGKQNGDAEDRGPPLKRKCIAPLSDADSTLMKQVARISAKFGPNLTTAAAEAAVTALCEETPCAKQLFEYEKECIPNGNGSPALNKEPERELEAPDSEMKEVLSLSETQETSSQENTIPLTLRIRAAIATALGAAGAHAKLLADQEVREMEHLVGTIIETQMKKMRRKLEHIEELETIMEQEYDRIEELEESIVAERIDVLQKAFNAGISRWRDHIAKS